MTAVLSAAAFRARWEALHGLVFEAPRADELEDVVRDAAVALTGDASPQSILAYEPPDPLIPWAAAFPAPAWDYHALTTRDGVVLLDGRPARRESLMAVAATAALGITGAVWAAADTGTVAVYSQLDGPGSSLLPTLLPPAHLMILRTCDVLPSLGDGLRVLARQRHEAGRLPRMVKLISGPSSTADIEGQLWVGVHGPARVGVLLVGSSENGRS